MFFSERCVIFLAAFAEFKTAETAEIAQRARRVWILDALDRLRFNKMSNKGILNAELRSNVF
jgi:hypothetical protein